MKTQFGMANRLGGTVEINLKQDTIGSGKLGAKSAGLRVYRPLFEATERSIDGEERRGRLG